MAGRGHISRLAALMIFGGSLIPGAAFLTALGGLPSAQAIVPSCSGTTYQISGVATTGSFTGTFCVGTNGAATYTQGSATGSGSFLVSGSAIRAFASGANLNLAVSAQFTSSCGGASIATGIVTETAPLHARSSVTIGFVSAPGNTVNGTGQVSFINSTGNTVTFNGSGDAACFTNANNTQLVFESGSNNDNVIVNRAADSGRFVIVIVGSNDFLAFTAGCGNVAEIVVLSNVGTATSPLVMC